MKLIIAIINKDDSNKVASTLNKSGYYVTKLASTGGFLSKGNTTLLVGTDEEKVDDVIELIRSKAKHRNEKVPTVNTLSLPEVTMTTMVDVLVGGATIFVIDVDQFYKI